MRPLRLCMSTIHLSLSMWVDDVLRCPPLSSAVLRSALIGCHLFIYFSSLVLPSCALAVYCVALCSVSGIQAVFSCLTLFWTLFVILHYGTCLDVLPYSCFFPTHAWLNNLWLYLLYNRFLQWTLLYVVPAPGSKPFIPSVLRLMIDNNYSIMSLSVLDD